MDHLFLKLLLYTVGLSQIILCDASCHDRVDAEDTHEVDLSYMFTENELHLLRNHHNYDQFLPGLEALVRPYFALVATADLEDQGVDDMRIGALTLHAKSGQYLRASYGKMSFGKAYLLSIDVSADPFVKLSASLVLSNVKLKFLEYNATISSGDYIGYNLEVAVDLEVAFEIELEPVGSVALAHLHQNIVGAGEVTFTDQTDCLKVERRKDLHLGRICGEQVLIEMGKWNGSGNKVIEFLKPVIFKAVHCAVNNMIHNLVEMCASYAVLLAK